MIKRKHPKPAKRAVGTVAAISPMIVKRPRKQVRKVARTATAAAVAVKVRRT
jgi:hypothetical protein